MLLFRDPAYTERQGEDKNAVESLYHDFSRTKSIYFLIQILFHGATPWNYSLWFKGVLWQFSIALALSWRACNRLKKKE